MRDLEKKTLLLQGVSWRSKGASYKVLASALTSPDIGIDRRRLTFVYVKSHNTYIVRLVNSPYREARP